MKLIFLYGPPAVGKLTIAKILEERTNFRLLHNHLLQNPISEIFSFDNLSNHLLVREFRLRILEEAAKSDINLIATFGIAGNDPFSHIADVIKTITDQHGECYLVHLTSDKDTLLSRVDHDFRKQHGKNLSKEKLEEIIEMNEDIFSKYAHKDHLTIDTSDNSPHAAADQIIQFYKLP